VERALKRVRRRGDPEDTMSLTLSRILKASAVLFGLVAVARVASVLLAKSAVGDEQHATARQAQFKQLGDDLAGASEFLTDQVRQYTATGERAHLDAYWHEIDVTRTRDKAVAQLERLGATADEMALVQRAKQSSDTLVNTEARAMRLVLAAQHTPAADVPQDLLSVQLSTADRALAPAAQMELARRLVFGKAYAAEQQKILAPMDRFQELLNGRAAKATSDAHSSSDLWMAVLIALTAVVVVAIALVGRLFFRKLAAPVAGYVRALRERDRSDLGFALEPAGVVEVRELAAAFNEQFRANQRVTERLLGDLTGVISEVSQTASGLSAASQQMATTSEEAGRAVGEIASAVGDGAHGAERQVRMTEAARASAQETADAAENARRVSDEGRRASERAAEAMQAVRTSTGQVTDAIRSLAA
jgi:hypothetical protein